MPGAALDLDQRTFTVSQSWLQDFMRCPERARQELLDPKFGYNDATGLGTALHLFMEKRLQGQPFIAAHALAEMWLADQAKEETFAWVKVKTIDTLFRHLNACIDAMERHVIPQLPDGGLVETKVSARLARAGEWSVVLEGTPDYIDPFGRVWDWKTASSEYNGHEAANWMIQPTSYTYLATKMSKRPITEFTYAIAVKPHGQMQFIDVVRTERDWRWLSRIAVGALMMTRNMLALPWPVNHTHYLCSPHWCQHWNNCRGKFLHESEGDT